MHYDIPQSQIAEVTLIGTGGGYGESTVIHYGNNNWAIVDSCIDPYSGDCLPLSYLKKIGVDVKKSVKMIICTHWHNDHIRGLSRIISECETAEFIIGKVLDKRKFLYMISLDYQKVSDRGTTTSTKEFVECLKIIKERGLQTRYAIVDRLLLTEKNENVKVEIFSLSPSDYTLEQYDSEISALITNYGAPDKKIIMESPNDKSIVVQFDFGTHKAILGADLEVSSNNNSGWLNILNNSRAVRNKKASLFKIPHHGSENGYHERIWLELLTDTPVSKLTPWNRKAGLPAKEMLKLYKTKTDKLYITSNPLSMMTKMEPKKIKRDKEFGKILDIFKIKITEVRYTFGLVRSRVDMNDSEAKWHTDVDGNGFLVSNI